MLEINVREARKNLSGLLDRVSSGEEVVILRRGKVVAKVSPPARPVKRLPSLAAFRSELDASSRTATDLIREERDER